MSVTPENPVYMGYCHSCGVLAQVELATVLCDLCRGSDLGADGAGELPRTVIGTMKLIVRTAHFLAGRIEAARAEIRQYLGGELGDLRALIAAHTDAIKAMEARARVAAAAAEGAGFP